MKCNNGKSEQGISGNWSIFASQVSMDKVTPLGHLGKSQVKDQLKQIRPQINKENERQTFTLQNLLYQIKDIDDSVYKLDQHTHSIISS